MWGLRIKSLPLRAGLSKYALKTESASSRLQVETKVVDSQAGMLIRRQKRQVRYVANGI